MVALAHPTSVPDLTQHVAKEAFVSALGDDALQVRVMEKQPNTIEEALGIAGRLEAYENTLKAQATLPSEFSKGESRHKQKHVYTVESEQSHTEQQLQKQFKELQQEFANFRSQGHHKGPSTPKIKHGSPAQADQSSGQAAPQSSGRGATAGRSRGRGRGRGNGPPQGEPFCHNCKVYDHHTRDCWTNPPEQEPDYRSPEFKAQCRALDLCFICSKTGHWAQNCPQRKVLPIRSRVLFCSSEAPRAYVNAEFHGRPLRCMLDTGCDRSVIGRRLLARKKLSPSKYSLTAAGQTPLKVDGDAHIKFSIEGNPMEADVSVSPELDELLLGCDWLTKQGGSWDFKEGTLCSEGLEISLHLKFVDFNCRRISATESCTIPPYHEMNVPVKLEGGQVHQSSVEWALGTRPMQDGVLVARTLFSDERNVKVAQILNYREKPFEIGTGDFVGTAEPVTVLSPPMPTKDHHGERPASDRDREWKMHNPNVSHQRRYAMRVKEEEKQEHVQCLVDGLPRDLAPWEHKMAEAFIRSRAHSFSKADFDIGRTDIIKHRINTGTNHPHCERLHRHPTTVQ